MFHFDEHSLFAPENNGRSAEPVPFIDARGDGVHRDIKPKNVLLSRGQWKIADFGITMKNVVNSINVASRRPDGIFPTRMRQILLGVRWDYH